MSKSFKEVLNQINVTEGKEPPQSYFDYDKVQADIQKEIDLQKKWAKYYKANKNDVDVSGALYKNTLRAIKSLEAAWKGIEDYYDAIQ